jgi:hypothetical protein
MELGPWSFTLQNGTDNLMIADADGSHHLHVNGVQLPVIPPEGPQAGTAFAGRINFSPPFETQAPIVFASGATVPTLLPISNLSTTGFNYPNDDYVVASAPAYRGYFPYSLTQLVTGQVFVLTGWENDFACWVVDNQNVLQGPIPISLPIGQVVGDATHVTLSNGKPAIFVSTAEDSSTTRLHALVGSDNVPTSTTTWTRTTLASRNNSDSFVAGFSSIGVVPNPFTADGWILAPHFQDSEGSGCMTISLNDLGTAELNTGVVHLFPTATATVGPVAVGRVPGRNRVILATPGAASEGIYMKYTDDMLTWQAVDREETESAVFMRGQSDIKFDSQMSAINGQIAMMANKGTSNVAEIATSADGITWSTATMDTEMGGSPGYNLEVAGAVLFEHGSPEGFPAILTYLAGNTGLNNHNGEYWVSNDAEGSSWSSRNLPYDGTTADDYIGARQIFNPGLPLILYYQYTERKVRINYPTFSPITWIATPRTN